MKQLVFWYHELLIRTFLLLIINYIKIETIIIEHIKIIKDKAKNCSKESMINLNCVYISCVISNNLIEYKGNISNIIITTIRKHIYITASLFLLISINNIK